MKGKSAVVTTHNIIQDLINDRIVIKVNDQKNRQTHNLYINYKNQFNCLKSDIDEVYRIVRNYIGTVRAASEQKLLKESQFGDLVHLTQLIIYTRISLLARAVLYNIKSASDRQTLYLRLLQVVAASSEPNKHIVPFLETGVNAIMNETGTLNARKGEERLILFRDSICAMLCPIPTQSQLEHVSLPEPT